MKQLLTKAGVSLFLFMACACCAMAQTAFRLVPLGVKGGVEEGNLSAYLLAPADSSRYICLDAGTLHAGIEQAIHNGLFRPPASEVLRRQVSAYFISHPHLDHVAGLILNSPEDSTKDLYGLPFCLNIIRDYYLTWKSWANFADSGDAPRLKKYHYAYLQPGTETPIAHTSMQVTAFPLSHAAPYQSTAFLIRHGQHYLLYLGDTGADELEQSSQLRQLWTAVAPLVASHQLKALLIEASFPDEQPVKQLFGHLTPRLLLQEMQVLASLAGKANLRQLPVVVTHLKPSGNNEQRIREQLLRQNNLQLHLIFPQQGQLLQF